MTITADNIQMLSVGESAYFMSLLFKNNVGISEKKHLFRILYENNKILVLKGYSSSGSGLLTSMKADIKEIWTRTDLCIMKKSTLYIQPVGASSKQKVKENVIAFYDDCPSLQTQLSNNEMEDVSGISGQKAAADYYAENCK